MTQYQQRTRRPLRLALLLFLAYASLIGLFQGIQNILIPSAVERLAPDGKVATLALLSTLSAIATVVALLAGGWLSDRTRSRWGRRTPSLVVAGALSALLALVLGFTTSLAGLVVVMPLLWFAANYYQTVVTAILPDRVAAEHRGFVSGAIALGVPVGIFEGVNIAAAAPAPWIGYALLALPLAVSTIALVVLEREPSSLIADAPRAAAAPPPPWRRTFADRDFTLAFVSRFLLFLAYFTVASYLFYVMQDYVGRACLPGQDAARRVSMVLSLVTLAWLIVTPLTALIADRVGHSAGVVGVVSILIGMVMLIPALSDGWSAMLVFGVGSGLTFGIYFAIDLKLVSMVLPSSASAGRDIGLMGIAGSGPTVLAPALAAAIIELSGFPALFAVGALLAIGGGIAAFPIRVRSTQ